MIGPLRLPLINWVAPAADAARAPFLRLSTLWIQITGTWCNLECVHRINASGPADPWLKPVSPEVVRRAIREAEDLGVKEIYFTGGKPFLHVEMLALLGDALEVAPTTVLTNGTLIDEAMADGLAALARRASYSLEVRVSLDDTDPEADDRVRGAGSFSKAVAAIVMLSDRGLLPIVTATASASAAPAGEGMYERFRASLMAHGVEKARVKILPVFALGRLGREGDPRLTEADLAGFDRGFLQCSESRVVGHGGVYACPILAGLSGARLTEGTLKESFADATSTIQPA
jgi:AdoMet-dependent heme synthase